MVGVAVYLRTKRAAAKMVMLDWLHIAAGQHMRGMVTVNALPTYHDGARPAMPERPCPIQ